MSNKTRSKFLSVIPLPLLSLALTCLLLGCGGTTNGTPEALREPSAIVQITTGQATGTEAVSVSGIRVPVSEPTIVDLWPNAAFDGTIRFALAYPGNRDRPANDENTPLLSPTDDWVLLAAEGQSDISGNETEWQELSMMSREAFQGVSRPIGEVLRFADADDRDSSQAALNEALNQWAESHPGKALYIYFMVAGDPEKGWQLFGVNNDPNPPAGGDRARYFCCRILACGQAMSNSCTIFGCRNVSCSR
jgi:hypothetical protein